MVVLVTGFSPSGTLGLSPGSVSAPTSHLFYLFYLCCCAMAQTFFFLIPSSRILQHSWARWSTDLLQRILARVQVLHSAEDFWTHVLLQQSVCRSSGVCVGSWYTGSDQRFLRHTHTHTESIISSWRTVRTHMTSFPPSNLLLLL